jgi:glutamate-5-semialdehyde dehydrogenase
MPEATLTQAMAELAREAKAGALALARARRPEKDRFLRAAARLLKEREAEILAANAKDLERARAAATSAALLDRLALDAKRLSNLGRALEEVALLDDPVGQIEGGWRRPNGLEVSRRRIPLGVILIIYEARPNVTVDAAALCVKAGNAVILRGGSESLASNTALARVLSSALAEAGLDPRAIRCVETPDRQAIYELLSRADEIDLCIPRGGSELVKAVSAAARMPVLAHERGVCHAYVDASADIEMALRIIENGKAQRPAVCNALETLLVSAEVAPKLLPLLRQRLPQVELRADPRALPLLPGAKPAAEADWYAEYLDLILAVRVVDSIDEAMAHIARYGSRHTETIITSDAGRAERFLDEVQSATVLVNASTRFADGGELGLGAEIGISTTRVHAFGPMGLRELTTTKFVVRGSGQVR